MLVGRHHTVGKESLGPRLLGTRLALKAHGSRGDEGQCGVGILLVLACEPFQAGVIVMERVGRTQTRRDARSDRISATRIVVVMVSGGSGELRLGA